MCLRWSFFSTIWAKIIRVCPGAMSQTVSSDLGRIQIQFLIWTIPDPNSPWRKMAVEFPGSLI